MLHENRHPAPALITTIRAPATQRGIDLNRLRGGSLIKINVEVEVPINVVTEIKPLSAIFTQSKVNSRAQVSRSVKGQFDGTVWRNFICHERPVYGATVCRGRALNPTRVLFERHQNGIFHGYCDISLANRHLD